MRLTTTLRLFRVVLGVATSVAFGVGAASGQGKGQGGIVIRDTDKDGLAPIYVHEEGDRLEAKAARGDYVAGITTVGLVHQYQFERKNARVHVIYFSNKEQKGLQRNAWMDESDLATFTYECGCGFGRHSHRGSNEEECSPLALEGFASRTWNACFQEARDKKLAELKAQWAGGGTANDAASSSASPKKSTEKPMTNDDVIALVKADLGDEIVIDKIRSSPEDKLDTSTDALIHLKKAGASKAVIDAMVKRKAER